MVTLETAKAHCRVDHNEDDDLIRDYLGAAIEYAESYQTKSYTSRGGSVPDEMSNKTEQAIKMLVSYWYDNRDLSWTNTAQISQLTAQDRTMIAVHALLYFERRLRI